MVPTIAIRGDGQIEAQEAAFADEIAAQFAGVISRRHPRPTPVHCMELAQILAAVERASFPTPGTKIVEGSSRTTELLHQASVQSSALLATIVEMEKHRAIPDDWPVTTAMKAALTKYLTIVHPRKAGRTPPAWEPIFPVLLPPTQRALVNAGWKQAAVTDEGPVASLISWALERVWGFSVDQRTIARQARRVRERYGTPRRSAG
jgi:hypothetical protein